MNVDTLLGNFEVLAEAPDGIEKLRELILRLAAEGLLIDPSLSENEIVELIASNNKSANKPELKSFCNSRGKVVYEIQIADAADFVQQAQSKIKTNQIKPSGAHPVVDQGQQFIAGFIDGIAPINASDNAVLVFGDHTRNIKYIDFDFVVGADGVKVLRTKYLDPKFFYYMARSINLPSRGYGRHYRAFCSSYIPIFSQTEQMMTVSTIEKLMALCDQLEQQQKQRDILRTAARKSAIDAISTATTPEELETAWRRINNNWEVIADTPESIDALRTLILNLAVRGQLKNKLGDAKRRETSFIELGSVLTLEYGKPLDKSLRTGEGGIPVYGANGVKAMTAQSLVKERGIVVGRKGSAGEVNMTEGPFWPLDVTFFAKFDHKIFDLKYLYYLLKSLNLPQMARGIKPGINRNDVNKLKVLSVDLEEQKLIVSKVDELMELCDQIELALISRSQQAEKFVRSVVNVS